MTNPAPIRVIGQWDKLGEDEQARAVSRGLDKIFDPGLRSSIAALVEDVRDRGDAALVDALAKFDGCEVDTTRLRVTV